jgi:two-component system, NarL family, sensor histidine kinase DesK
MLHHEQVTEAHRGKAVQRHLARFRIGQLLGLVFLIGPLYDLAGATLSPVRVAGILVVLAAFVTLYVALLPPIRLLARRGERAIGGGVAVLAALAALTLALGAPRSFAVLFVYVIAVAGVVLPLAAAVVVTAVGAVAVGLGLALAGSDRSAVAAWTLTILGIGALTSSLGRAMRTNEELRRMREERARLAVSEERVRIARDLHDLLGHTLTLISLKNELARRLIETDPRRAEEELAEAGRVAREALAEVRDAVHGYRRPAFADALDSARATLAAAGIECRVEAAESGLSSEVEGVFAWAVREATTNVVRHSNARTCAITLSIGGGDAALQIEDDGTIVAGTNGDGAGLLGLAERARHLDGTLEAGARADGGYRVRLTVPLETT